MINMIETIQMPEWLSKNTFEFNIKSILNDSLYYPSAYFDGVPVKYLMGNIFSFIYVDYGVSKEQFLTEINNNGFNGYKIIHSQSIDQKELTPNGWSAYLPPDHNENHSPQQYNGDWIKDPFCEWIIFEREDEKDDSHNPKRFSLLYLCADGAATYQAIYLSNDCKPKIIAIIRPGTGFGCNWTDFTDRKKIFARSVFSNTNLLPNYIISNLSCDAFNWAEYKEIDKILNNGHLPFNIFKLD